MIYNENNLQSLERRNVGESIGVEMVDLVEMQVPGQ